jgi:hypothetical protein
VYHHAWLRDFLGTSQPRMAESRLGVEKEVWAGLAVHFEGRAG